jgi:transglycosylase-like protein with SLT domain
MTERHPAGPTLQDVISPHLRGLLRRAVAGYGRAVANGREKPADKPELRAAAPHQGGPLGSSGAAPDPSADKSATLASGKPGSDASPAATGSSAGPAPVSKRESATTAAAGAESATEAASAKPGSNPGPEIAATPTGAKGAASAQTPTTSAQTPAASAQTPAASSQTPAASSQTPADPGQTAPGEAAADGTASGGITPGGTTTGGTAVSETTPGSTAASGTTSAGTAAGATAPGATPAGGTAPGGTAAGATASDATAAGGTAPGATAAGATAAGGTAPGGTVAGSAAAGGLAAAGGGSAVEGAAGPGRTGDGGDKSDKPDSAGAGAGAAGVPVPARGLRRANPVLVARKAGRSTSEWAKRPSGRLVLPGIIALLLLGAAGTAGVYLVPQALQAAPSPSATPGFPLEATGPGAPASFPAGLPTGSAPAGPTNLPPTTTEPVQPVPNGARPADALNGWAQQVGTKVGIPVVAVQAYGYAELVLTRTMPGCHLSWTTIAAIASVESAHGSANGAVLGVDGSVSPPIYGLPLDGKGGRQLIADSDQGTLDGDTTYDRAVGPLQFIPSTWNSYKVDADNSGIADPNDIDDASLTAATYLCQGGRDLSKAESWWDAILSYNAVQPYAQKVFDAANDYGRRSRT